MAADSGDGERPLLRSLDYPCTRRLRLRRLLAYHRRHSWEDVYKIMGRMMGLVFEVKHLVTLVKRGHWRVASSYVSCFVDDSMSNEATLLLLFLNDLLALNDFAEGIHMVTCFISDWILSIYKEPVLAEYPCFATLVADVLFLRSDHAGAFLNWELVRNKAAEMVKEMVYKTPELKDKLHFQCGPQNLYHVVPIRRSSFHQRRHVHVKIACHKHSTDYARSYLQMKKRLPSLTRVASPGYSEDSAQTRGELRMALLEIALQAGGPSVLEQSHAPEYSSIDGFPLVKMLSEPPFLPKFVGSPSPVYEPEFQQIPQSPTAMAS